MTIEIINASDLFMEASRNKYRFDTVVGKLTVEDLWDLPLESSTPSKRADLNSIASNLFDTINRQSQIPTSFVTRSTPSTKVDKVADNMFKIVQHIIQVKLDEADSRKKKADAKVQATTLTEILNRRKQAALETVDVATLEAMLKQLEEQANA